MEQPATYLIVIVPPVTPEYLRRFLESLEELRKMNRGGDHESVDTDCS